MKISRYMSIALSLIALTVLMPAGTLLAAGNELTHHKSGISLMPGGIDGVDYVFERYYHDPLIDDHGVIYIKDATQISLAHNDMNRYDDGDVVGVSGADGVPDSGDEGIIRYKTDMDWNWKWTWSDSRNPGDMAESNKCPRYTAPFSFDTLQYFDGAAVLGNTGPSESISPYPPLGTTTFYFRGLLDEFGDEWHIITVGDDDSFRGTTTKYSSWSSDGKIFYFIVNPKTPCLTLSKLNSAAQWYTTPAKGYFVPKIHSQSSYLTADVAITLQNITDGQGMQYRIDELGSTWIDYTGPINVNALGLSGDTAYSFRYRIGTTGPQKVRKLHFKPGYPSDAEPHPSKVLWKNDQDRQRTVNLIRSNAIYTANFNQLLGPFRGGHGAYAQPLMTGSRLVGCYASANAFPVYVDGFDAHPLQEQLTRDYMLDNSLNLDPIGLERSHNDANPCREMVYHGYYFVVTPLAVATAYDLLIKTNRYPDRPLGFTAIEDYKIRDNLAAFSMTTLNLDRPDWPDRPGWPNRTAVPDDYGPANAGMWSTAREIGLQIISMTLPDYDTPYYGTSGSDGTPATHPWTPYPDVPRSWFEISNSKELGAGIWNMVSDTTPPIWGDREGYWGGDIMGRLFYRLSNARANFDGYHWSHLEQAYQLAMDNQFKTLKVKSSDDGWIHFYSGMVINEHFPQLAQQAYDALSATTTIDEKDLGNSMWRQGVPGLCYIRLDWNNYSTAPLIITTAGVLSSGTAGIAYSTTLAADGGTTPYTWGITSGSLPAGLGLVASSGAITGTPSTVVTANVDIRVTDSVGASITNTFSLTINPQSEGPIIALNAIREVLSSQWADGYLRHGLTPTGQGFATGVRGYYSSAVDMNTPVFVFVLPDLGGESIASANLSVFGTRRLANDAYNGGLDLYGVRYAPATAATSDTELLASDEAFSATYSVSGNNGTGIMQGFFPLSTTTAVDGTYETDGAADIALGAWLQSQYDAGAQAGDCVFLRLTPNTVPTSVFGRGWNLTAADSATDRPALTITTILPPAPPPPPTAALGGGSFGIGQDVINWTTAQGSGYVYSVYYSTNLLDGFLPLLTGLVDTVQSLTNTIDVPVVFYKVEVQ